MANSRYPTWKEPQRPSVLVPFKKSLKILEYFVQTQNLILHKMNTNRTALVKMDRVGGESWSLFLLLRLKEKWGNTILGQIVGTNGST
jgi:hypothetical protein